MGSSEGPAAQLGLRAAWLSLMLVVPCTVLALFLGETIISLLGYRDGPGVPPTWVMLAASPALLAIAIPTVPTWLYGNRARHSGARHALVPFGLAVAIVVTFVLLTPMQLHH